MATFFGEVVSVNSRAVDEDEEEDGCVPHVNVIYHDNDFHKKPFRCVLFTCSAATYAFAKSQLLSLTSTGEIQAKKVLTVETELNDEALSNEEEFQTGLKYKHSSRILCKAYVSQKAKDVLICTCEESIWDDEYQPLTIEKLFEVISITKNTTVAVLGSENWTYYKHPENSPIMFPIIRYLSSSEAAKKGVSVPRLEQPNIVSGFGAAVLTFCELKGIPGIVYICYESTSDSSTMDALLPVMQIWPFSELQLQSSSQCTVVTEIKDTGNLYT